MAKTYRAPVLYTKRKNPWLYHIVFTILLKELVQPSPEPQPVAPSTETLPLGLSRTFLPPLHLDTIESVPMGIVANKVYRIQEELDLSVISSAWVSRSCCWPRARGCINMKDNRIWGQRRLNRRNLMPAPVRARPSTSIPRA